MALSLRLCPDLPVTVLRAPHKAPPLPPQLLWLFPPLGDPLPASQVDFSVLQECLFPRLPNLSAFKSPVTQAPEPRMLDRITSQAEESLLWALLNQKRKTGWSTAPGRKWAGWGGGWSAGEDVDPQGSDQTEEGPSGKREVRTETAWKGLFMLSSRAKRDE